MEADLQVQSADSVGVRASALSSKLLQEITAAVAAAIAETEASAQQALNDERQQFEVVERELRRQLAAALDDLEKQRDDARAVKNQYTIERAARARAEEWLAAAQSTQNQIAAGYTERLRAAEAEIEATRREARRLADGLEAESAERARLTIVLESIRSAMGGVTPLPNPGPSASSHADAPNVQSPANHNLPAEESNEDHGSMEQSPSDSARNLTFIGRPAAEPERRGPAPDPVLSAALTQLLDQVEESYQNDVASLQSPFDVVDRLVAQLRTSRELFLMRCNNDKTVADEEFDRQISELLDTKGSTAFGRHLGIAWHEMSQPGERAAPSAVA
jgi:hypothetical protein